MSDPNSKPRGCFQCSKRRIVCDGAQPTCIKCQKKGIECSGPGRFRFPVGVATRGKLMGSTIPVTNISPKTAFHEQLQTPQNIRWKSDRSPRRQRKNAKRTANADTSGSTDENGQNIAIQASSRNVNLRDNQETIRSRLRGHRDERVDDVAAPNPGQALALLSSNLIKPWVDPLTPEVRMYLSHFAEEVAPVMVILDKVSNGYRDFLLPLACEDEVLRSAITVVAAHHLALHQPYFQPIAEAGRSKLISRLRRDSLQATPEHVFNLSTWATLIVLLVGETVTGSSDYSLLLQNLVRVAQNIHATEQSATSQFLIQQTHMFRFLGQPLLGELQGIDTLRLRVDHYLDWTYYDLPPESALNRVLRVCRLAFIQASQIYLCRATSNEDQWERLESLKGLVSQIDPAEEGAHALVWVCFIAAADSTDPEHRRLFIDRMSQVFSRTGFRNILVAIQSLPAIWSQKDARWTDNLLQLAPTLVM